MTHMLSVGADEPGGACLPLTALVIGQVHRKALSMAGEEGNPKSLSLRGRSILPEVDRTVKACRNRRLYCVGRRLAVVSHLDSATHVRALEPWRIAPEGKSTGWR